MTNTIAICLGILILGLIAADIFLIEFDTITFLMRKLGDLIEYLAFWR
ncbi:hypothetical protein [Yoonia sp. 2307UL14-13]